MNNNNNSTSNISLNMGCSFLTTANLAGHLNTEDSIEVYDHNALSQLYETGTKDAKMLPEKSWPVLNQLVSYVARTRYERGHTLMFKSIIVMISILDNYPGEFEEKLHPLLNEYHKYIITIDAGKDFGTRLYKSYVQGLITTRHKGVMNEIRLKHFWNTLEILLSENTALSYFNLKTNCLEEVKVLLEPYVELRGRETHLTTKISRILNDVEALMNTLLRGEPKTETSSVNADEAENLDDETMEVIPKHSMDLNDRPLVHVSGEDIDSYDVRDALLCLAIIHEYYESDLLTPELKNSFQIKYVEGYLRPCLYAALKYAVDHAFQNASRKKYNPHDLAKKVIALHEGSTYFLSKLKHDDRNYHCNKRFFDEYLESANRVMDLLMFEPNANSTHFEDRFPRIPYPPMNTIQFSEQLERARQAISEYRGFGVVQKSSKEEI